MTQDQNIYYQAAPFTSWKKKQSHFNRCRKDSRSSVKILDLNDADVAEGPRNRARTRRSTEHRVAGCASAGGSRCKETVTGRQAVSSGGWTEGRPDSELTPVVIGDGSFRDTEPMASAPSWPPSVSYCPHKETPSRAAQASEPRARQSLSNGKSRSLLTG